MRLPKHIGIIPDGNRRWAAGKGLEKQEGYALGLEPGITLFLQCQELGIEEMSFYGFTADNAKRPSIQRLAFTRACVKAVDMLSHEDASLLVVGNTESAIFPKELLPYTTRRDFGKGGMKVNFLINYSPEWDLGLNRDGAEKGLRSREVSRVELIVRWGGRRRLSGFLPFQSAYADFYVVDDFWPDFKKEHLMDALEWYSKQDITLGG